MTFEDNLHACRALARERLAGWKAERERRIKAEEERDKWRKIASDAEKDADEAEENLLVFKAAQAFSDPRPLTADDITDEMVERAREVLAREDWVHPFDPETADMFDREEHADATRVIIATLTAALTEPPARPEGAERFDPVVDAAIRGHSDITSPDVVRAISDAIAAHLADPTRKEA